MEVWLGIAVVSIFLTQALWWMISERIIEKAAKKTAEEIWTMPSTAESIRVPKEKSDEMDTSNSSVPAGQ